MRDIATEQHNNGNLLEIYELLGRALEQGFNFNLAIVTYKKQMQISWIVESKTFEIRAYQNLARCYFYLQLTKKSEYYFDRVTRGKLESKTSAQRIIACEHYTRNLKQAKLIADKHEIFGHRVDFKSGKKIVDQTIVYSRAIDVIQKIMDDPKYGVVQLDSLEGIVFFETGVAERRTGLRKIRPLTPLENTRPQDVQSPSTLASDHMLLPKISQLDVDQMI